MDLYQPRTERCAVTLSGQVLIAEMRHYGQRFEGCGLKTIKGKGPVLTVSYVCLRLICSQSTSTYRALEVSHFMRCTNLQLTYLLTY